MVVVSILFLGSLTHHAYAAQAAAGFSILKNSSTDFEAIYTDGDQWARVVVRYTPTSTFYALQTSFDRTLAYSGTAVAMSDPFNILEAVLNDPRVDSDGYAHLGPHDEEYWLTSKFFDALIAEGVNSRPSSEERGTTLYAAAYTVARVLGDVPQREWAPEVWPYPGYDDQSLMPPELLISNDSELGGQAVCCGPVDCWNCSWDSGFPCNDWCAAGDHCNAIHGSGCGTIWTWPGHCPHQDSDAINGEGGPYNYCSNHTCGWTYQCFY